MPVSACARVAVDALTRPRLCWPWGRWRWLGPWPSSVSGRARAAAAAVEVPLHTCRPGTSRTRPPGRRDADRGQSTNPRPLTRSLLAGSACRDGSRASGSVVVKVHRRRLICSAKATSAPRESASSSARTTDGRRHGQNTRTPPSSRGTAAQFRARIHFEFVDAGLRSRARGSHATRRTMFSAVGAGRAAEKQYTDRAC